LNPVDPPASPPARVLVVDDDRRMLELLEITFTTHGFEVLKAADGDEAYRKAVTEHPDLIVLDVRLPRRSGYEVCEALRRERGERTAPIILVSAAGETDARVHGLSSGADDFLAKPFSPKELVARARRVLARVAEARDMRRQAVELERELSHARDEVRRSHLETRREQQLRELAFGVGRDLSRTLDFDTLARRFLGAAQGRLGVSTTALLARTRDGRALEAAAVRGDAFDRVAALTLAVDGPLATRLAALGRPLPRREIERDPELRAELPALVAGGFVLAAPLVGPEGLEGVLLADERADGREPTALDLELVAGLCDLVAGALRNARRYRAPLEQAVVLLAGVAGGDVPARNEAALLADRVARATRMTPRQRGLLAHAALLGDAMDAPGVAASLARLGEGDSTGWMAELRALLSAARAPLGVVAGGDPGAARAVTLAAFARRLVIARRDGDTLAHAAARAVESLGEALDDDARQAIEAAVREAPAHERPAA
jgi:two-component system phosphate regulon response regulator PhoB